MKFLRLVMAMLIAGSSQAESLDLTPREVQQFASVPEANGTWEMQIPRGVRTMADVKRYAVYRKRLMLAGLAASALSFASYQQSRSYIRRGKSVNVAPTGSIVTFPDGSSGFVFVGQPELYAKQRALYKKSDAFQYGAIGLAMVAAGLFSLALSFRF